MSDEPSPDLKREDRTSSSAPAEDATNSTDAPKEGESSTASKVSRKRTKTGCLTCRKRRIKCGEQRPICANCIKSKRSCEGYNQPVVFKPGLGSIRPGTTYGLSYGPYPIQPVSASSHFQPIAPAPLRGHGGGMVRDQQEPVPAHIEVLREMTMRPPNGGQGANTYGVRIPPLSPQPSPQSAGFQNNYFGHSPVSDSFSNSNYSEPRTLPYQHQGSTAPTTPMQTQTTTVGSSGGGVQFVPGHQSQGGNCAFNPPLDGRYSLSRRQSENFQSGQHTSSPGHNESTTPTAPSPHHELPVVIQNSFSHHQLQPSPEHESTFNLSAYESITGNPSFSVGGSNYYDQEQEEEQVQGQAEMGQYQGYEQQQEQMPQQQYQPQQQQQQQQQGQFTWVNQGQNLPQGYYGQQQQQQQQEPPRQMQQTRPRIQVQEVHHGHYQQHQQQQQQTHLAPSHDQHDLPSDYDEDDPYDVTDDDMEEYAPDEDSDTDMADTNNTIVYRGAVRKILDTHGQPSTSTSTPHPVYYSSYLPDPGALRAYYPSYSASPLLNPTTAKIFCHFVYVLGPSLSIFERTSPNPGLAFSPDAPPTSTSQNIWSYTIPMLSLQHPPLLHALLALSSLHLAKLTRGVENSSLLHYNIALRRLGKAISDDRLRTDTSTLAATLLLAFYETMAGEHNKWSRHIHGAKLLIREINFDRLNERIAHLEDIDSSGTTTALPNPTALRHAVKKQRRETRETRDPNSNPKPKKRGQERKFSRKDIEASLLQSDLFWWYCKMDAFQSILSGGPLVLDYSLWNLCPPRAKLGTLGTTTGSSDHFLLLLGKVADFQAGDMGRKKRVERGQGGMWVPPPEMNGPPRGFLWRGRGGGAGGGQSQMGIGGAGMGQGLGGNKLGGAGQGQERRPSNAGPPQQGGPPPAWQGGPPPGWTGGPPPGWTGPPQGQGQFKGPAQGFIGPNKPTPPPGFSPGVGGPPAGWQGGPPPGWVGGPPQGMQGPPQGGPPQGMNGAEGGKQMGGPPPGWTGGPPPGWTGGPPQGMGGPPQGPNGSAPQTPGGPPPGWTGGPPPGWTGGPPPGWTGGPPGQGCPPSGIPPAMMQQMMQQMMGQGGSPPSDSGEPKMYGMTPVTPNANQLPRAFAEVFGQQPIPQQPSTPSPPPEGAPDDEYAALEAETLKAEARWAGIKRELEEFKANLGPDYDPLPDYAMPVRETPFGGPAIYFRTFPMAILHTLYYTALIILERCHPSMPAMSMQAAMVCADRAEHIANTIGRITAGLFPESGTEQINPARGASLIESTIPLFFAGVQYRHASQREWLKHKLREIHRITGWASASRVLLGCYRAWEIAGEKGLAERFTRPPDSEEEDVPRPETEGGTIVGGEEEGRNFVVRAGARLEMAVGLLGEPGTIEEVVARM